MAQAGEKLQRIVFESRVRASPPRYAYEKLPLADMGSTVGSRRTHREREEESPSRNLGHARPGQARSEERHGSENTEGASVLEPTARPARTSDNGTGLPATHSAHPRGLSELTPGDHRQPWRPLETFDGGGRALAWHELQPSRDSAAQPPLAEADRIAEGASTPRRLPFERGGDRPAARPADEPTTTAQAEAQPVLHAGRWMYSDDRAVEFGGRNGRKTAAVLAEANGPSAFL